MPLLFDCNDLVLLNENIEKYELLVWMLIFSMYWSFGILVKREEICKVTTLRRSDIG